jgi:peptidoglycan/xylan/chitin deacetylase (PgdA/CDA1 family)
VRLDESKSVALKVDIDTLRGAIEGVPALLELFDRYDIKATFLFSVGPDNTGRALKRIFRPGFFSKVKRTSVVDHYGIKTLLYGVLLPSPFISKIARETMIKVVEKGHEVGVHCYDHVLWQDYVRYKDEDWTRNQMQLAHDAYVECIGNKPNTIGAAGWQLNNYVPSVEDNMGFRYASDTRGDSPFYPVAFNKKALCLQIPTTLPTLDELLGIGGIDADNIAQHVVDISRQSRNIHGHVFTLHAELEGMKLLPVMDQLIQLWRQDEFQLVCLEQRFSVLNGHILPVKKLTWKSISGRSGEVATSM